MASPPPTAETVWDQVRERLQGTLTPASYQLTFDRVRPVRLGEDRLTLAVDTEFARSWILQRYLTVLRDALFEVLGTDLRVELEVTAAKPAASAGDPGGGGTLRPSAPVPAGRTGLPPRAPGGLQSRFTFDAFVTGPSNRFAHAAALAVAETPAGAYNPLFVYGGPGLGKTHLLQAIGHFVARNHPEQTVRYVSVETFTNEFINALRDKGQDHIRSFKERYRSVDILLIDDIQSLAGKEGTQEEFFHTFNALHEGGKQIVISSDRPPKEIARLEDRLRSRFEMGLITDVQPPDLETRIAILRKRVQADGYQVHDPEVLTHIAARVSTNVRQLEGALTRVVAHASIGGRPLTVDLAREALQNLFPAGDQTISVEMIQQEVCRHYGVSMTELTGHQRTKRVVTPRQVAMYLSRELTDYSLPAIGRAFGGRDHTTVIYAVQKVARQMPDAGDVYGAVQTLTTRLKGE